MSEDIEQLRARLSAKMDASMKRMHEQREAFMLEVVETIAGKQR